MTEQEKKAKIKHAWQKQNPNGTEKEWDLYWESLTFWTDTNQ